MMRRGRRRRRRRCDSRRRRRRRRRRRHEWSKQNRNVIANDICNVDAIPTRSGVRLWRNARM